MCTLELNQPAAGESMAQCSVCVPVLVAVVVACLCTVSSVVITAQVCCSTRLHVILFLYCLGQQYVLLVVEEQKGMNLVKLPVSVSSSDGLME